MKFSCYLFGILYCFLIATPAMALGINAQCEERSVVVTIEKSSKLASVEGVSVRLSYCRNSSMKVFTVNKTEKTNSSGIANFKIKAKGVIDMNTCKFNFSYLNKSGDREEFDFLPTFEIGCDSMEMDVKFE